MKKAILLALLLSIFGCTKSSTDNGEATKNDLSEIPADAVAFFTGHRTKAWDDYLKKFKLNDVNYMKKIWAKNIENFSVPLKGLDPAQLGPNAPVDEQTLKSLQENLDNATKLSNDIVEGFQKYGTVGVDGKEPRIKTQIFYLTPSDNSFLSASFLADGTDMTSSLSFIKSLFTKNNIPQSAMQFGDSQGFNYGNFVNFAANDNRLTISTDSNTITDKLAHNTVTKDITSQPNFSEIYNKVDHNDAVSVGFINVEALLNQIVNSKNQKNEFAQSVNQFVKDISEDIPGGDLLAINPIKAVLITSKMDDFPSNTYAVSFKKTNNPDINKALVPYTPKGTNSIFRTVPNNTTFVISFDGTLFENIQKLLPQDVAMFTAMAAPYISGTKSLNIVGRISEKDGNAMPEIAVVLEGSVASSVSQLITASINPTQKTVDGITIYSDSKSAGVPISMATSGENLILSNSEDFIVESINGKKKLWDVIPASSQKAITTNSFISSYMDMSEFVKIIKEVKNETKMYGVDTDDLDLLDAFLQQKAIGSISFNGELLLVNNSTF